MGQLRIAVVVTMQFLTPRNTDKGGKVTSAGWQVTLCDLIWHVISRSGVVISITNCYIRFTYFTLLYFYVDVRFTRKCSDNCKSTRKI